MKRKKPPYIYNPSTNEFLKIKKESDDYDKAEKHRIYFLAIVAILVIILLIYQQFSLPSLFPHLTPTNPKLFAKLSALHL